MYQFIYSEKARRDLKSLDRKTADRILFKLDFYAKQENPLQFSKCLKGDTLGEYRFRIGDYRAIFDVDSKGNLKILLILRIKHRREVYRDI